MASGQRRPADFAGEGAAAPLAGLLRVAHEDLWACLFHFLGLAGLGSSAACCRALAACLWRDPAFWRVYGGPSSVRDLGPGPLSADALRDAFRRWLFHLGGQWATDFAALVRGEEESDFGADHTRLFAEATQVVIGLMPSDGRRSIAEFVVTLGALLSEYDPAQLDERDLAQGLVARVERRDDVFTAAEISSISLAYSQSVEYTELCQLGQGFDDGGPEMELFPISALHDELAPQDPGAIDDELGFGIRPTGAPEGPW